MISRGRVLWIFGDDYNADVITLYPRYSSVEDEEGLKKIFMVGVDPEMHKKVKKGDFLVAGKNFGHGHAHVQVHRSLKAAGVSAVIAESFNRVWFREAINVGLPVVVCKDITKKVNLGDELEVDLKQGSIRNLATGTVTQAEPLPDLLMEIVSAGGSVPYLRKKLEARQSSAAGR